MNPVPGIRRRDFLRATGIAGLGGATVGLLAQSPAGASPATAGPADPQGVPYPTLRRPFAMPGIKDQDWTGALFVGEGESRFALRVGLLTETGKFLREKMTNNLWRIGPMAPDGAYKEVQISTDERKITPTHLEALREVIAHPEQWSAAEVSDATDETAVTAEAVRDDAEPEHTIQVRYARADDDSSWSDPSPRSTTTRRFSLKSRRPGAKTRLRTGRPERDSAPRRVCSTSTAPATSGCRPTEPADSRWLLRVDRRHGRRHDRRHPGAPGTAAAALRYHLQQWPGPHLRRHRRRAATAARPARAT